MRSGEIAVPPKGTTFDKATHLDVGDLAVDSRKVSTLLRVRLKYSKTDPFRKGVDVFVGKTGNELCPVQVMVTYLRIRGWKPGPLFCTWEGKALSRTKFVAEVQKAILSRGKSARATVGIVSGVEQPPQLLLLEWEKQQLRCLADGQVQHTKYISRLLESILLSSRQCYRGSLQSAKQ